MSAEEVIKAGYDARLIILYTVLGLYVPFAIYELSKQRLKGDRTFYLTTLLYPTCFALKIVHALYFEVAVPTTDSISVAKVGGTIIQFFQMLACILLIYFIL
jgi:hypothetical protein